MKTRLNIFIFFFFYFISLFWCGCWHWYVSTSIVRYWMHLSMVRKIFKAFVRSIEFIQYELCEANWNVHWMFLSFFSYPRPGAVFIRERCQMVLVQIFLCFVMHLISHFFAFAMHAHQLFKALDLTFALPLIKNGIQKTWNMKHLTRSQLHTSEQNDTTILLSKGKDKGK